MRKILILAAAVFAFCGCNDKEENQPFAGIDNHITSFALTAKDGTVYRAALVGDEIVVSIPRNVSLEGAPVPETRKPGRKPVSAVEAQ